MLFTPYFWGCKYTNKNRNINKNIEFQHFDLLITFLQTRAYSGNALQSTNAAAIARTISEPTLPTFLGHFMPQISRFYT